MPPELVWAAPVGREPDPARGPLLQGVRRRSVAWPMLGLCRVPEHIAGSLSPVAWRRLDELALLLAQASRHDGFPTEAIKRAAAGVGAWWPMPADGDRRRWSSGLDVPALWAVMDTLLGLCGTCPAPDAGKAYRNRLDNARDAARNLQDAMQTVIGGPYPRRAFIASDQTLEARWGTFERALGALGPFFLLPVLTWPADRSFFRVIDGQA